MDDRPLLRRRILPRRVSDIDADIDEELRFHLEMRERDLRAAGLETQAAREAARARFGNVEAIAQELHVHDVRRHHRQRRSEMLEELAQDIRYGARKLLQQRGFTAVVIGVLALGIGATTALFSAVDAALLRPLPFREAERLVALQGLDIPMLRDGKAAVGEKVEPAITDAAAMTSTFDAVAAYADPG